MAKELKDDVQGYLLGGAKEDYKKKKAENKAKKIAEIKEEANIKTLKKKKKQYETKFSNKYANEIAAILMTEWKAENKLKKDKELKKQPEQLEAKIKLLQDNRSGQICDLYDKCYKELQDYVQNIKNVLEPNVEPKKTENDIFSDIEQAGNDIFTEKKKEAQEQAKKLQQMKMKLIASNKDKQDAQIDIDKINQKFAEIPLTIEDKMKNIQEILDRLLGKYLEKNMDPDNFDFDLDVLIEKMKAAIDPLLTCIEPLETVGGSVPILGELSQIFSMMSSANSESSLTKEEIKKKIGEMKPVLPENLGECAKTIFYNILLLAIKLPTLLISVILAMINVIYSKLKIITSVIPLGDFFPLTLIDLAMEAPGLIWNFSTTVPQYMYASVRGMLKDKIAEMMALSIPEIGCNLEELEDVDSDKPSKESKPKTKKKTYNTVNKEKLEIIKDAGYTLTDLGRILKNYKKIYDGSNGKINKYTAVTGRVDHWYGDDYSKAKATKTTITRYQGTPDDYETYLGKIFSGGVEQLKKGIKYEEYVQKESLCGAAYSVYKDFIDKKEPKVDIVVESTITPSIFSGWVVG